MPLYRYIAINDSGQKITGEAEGADEKALGDKLNLAGLYLLEANIHSFKKFEAASAGKIFLRPSWWAVWGWFMFCGIFLIAGICLLFLINLFWPSFIVLFVGLIFCTVAFLQRLAYRYFIFNDRLCSDVGILSRRNSEIQIAHIRNIRVDQGLDGRLFDFGTIIFETAGTYAGEVIFWGVKGPMELKEEIKQLMPHSSKP